VPLHQRAGERRHEAVRLQGHEGPPLRGRPVRGVPRRGLQHIAAPSKVNVPKAPLAAGTALTTGCGGVPPEPHDAPTREWPLRSIRASARWGQPVPARPATRATAPSRPGAWTPTSPRSSPSPPARVAVTCAVCHDPHGSSNDAGLRFPINTVSVATNLCMRCHQERPGADFSGMPPRGRRGPSSWVTPAGGRPPSGEGRGHPRDRGLQPRPVRDLPRRGPRGEGRRRERDVPATPATASGPRRAWTRPGSP